MSPWGCGQIGNSGELLVGMLNVAVTVKKSMVIFKNLKRELTYNFYSSYTFNGIGSMNSSIFLLNNVHTTLSTLSKRWK